MLPKKALFVHAHPDDETISTGGTIAKLVNEGVEVFVLTCTRGELGEVADPELKDLEGNPDALAEVRMKELARALEHLGVRNHYYLGESLARAVGKSNRRYLDSGMRWNQGKAVPLDSADPRSLCSAQPSELVADISAAIQSIAPDIVISYDKRGGYGHPDHVATSAAARRAAERFGIPYFEIVKNPNKSKTASIQNIEVTDVLETKRKALSEYKTQLTVRGDTIVHSGGQVEPISTVESFRNTGETTSGSGEWSQLGIGWKIATGLILLLLGLLVGTIATINHQITLGDNKFPLGVVLAIGISALLLVGMSLYFDYLPLVVCGAVGFVAPVILFSQKSFGGSVLIPSNSAGIAWLVGAVIIAIGSVAVSGIRGFRRVSMRSDEPPRKER